MSNLRSVFVSHPGLQHSHQLALALHEQGLLQSFWSSVPVAADDSEVPAWLPTDFKRRVKRVAIPRDYRRHPIFFQGLVRAGALLPRWFSRLDYAHRVWHAYDWWVSRQLPALRPHTVVAYENAAFHTFQAARSIGARCILDAPSLHHEAGSKLMDVTHTRYTDEINRRKDAEVAAADLILTCSPLAAQSYVEYGVDAAKVRPLLLGAELPEGFRATHAPRTRPLFLFAGVLSYRKAIDVVIEAFQRLHDERIDCEVHFVGGMADPEFGAAIEILPNGSYQTGVPQRALYQLLSEADCLLLPSRFDSFGMVVAEAMACGTPALVSTQCGSKAIIEAHPGSGWIIEPNADALFETVRHLVENRNELTDARQHALQAASDFTWRGYRRRAGALISEYLAQ